MILPELKREPFDSHKDISTKLSLMLERDYKATRLGNNIYFEKDNRQYCVNLSDQKLRDMSTKDQIKWRDLGNDYETLMNPKLMSYYIREKITFLEKESFDSFFEINSINIPIEEDKIRVDDYKKIFEQTTKNVIVISPPGTGKTYSIIEYFRETNQKSIIIMPFVLLVEENDKPSRTNAIFAETEVDKIKIAIDKNLPLISTYETFLYKIIPNIKNKWEYNLVIDEYHKMVIDSSLEYRGETIRKIKSEMFTFERIIGLTGTAEGAIVPSEEFETFKIVPHSTPDEFKVQISFTGAKEDESQTMLISELRKSVAQKKRVCIFWNDKKKLNFLKKYSIQELQIKTGKILLLDRDHKKYPEVKETINNSKIPDNISLILTTSVISSGINLNNTPIDTIIIMHESNIIEVVQFLHRFRDKKLVGEIIDLVPGAYEDHSELGAILNEINQPIEEYNTYTETYFPDLIRDFYSHREKSLDELKKLEEILSMQKINSIFDKKFGNLLLSSSIINSEYFYRANNEVKAFPEAIYRNELLRIFGQSLYEKDLRKMIYEYYGVRGEVNYELINLPAKIISNEETENTSATYETVNKDLVIKRLIDSHEIIIKYLIDNKLFDDEKIVDKVPDHIKKMSISSDPIIQNLDTDLVLDIIKEFIFFKYEVGFPKNIIEIILSKQKEDIESIIYIINYLRLRRKKKIDKGYRAEQRFARSMHNFLLKNKKFTKDEIKPYLRKVKDLPFIKYFVKEWPDRMHSLYEIAEISDHKTIRRYYHIKKTYSQDRILQNLGLPYTTSIVQCLRNYTSEKVLKKNN